MIVRCVASLPTRDQAKRLGEHYRPGKQEFGVVAGQIYVVFALKFLGGQPWVDVTDPGAQPGYLVGVPLCLFEFVDGRVPTIWEAGVNDNGELKIAPPSFFTKYYYDDLFEGVDTVVADFLRVRQQLELEAGMQRSVGSSDTRTGA